MAGTDRLMALRKELGRVVAGQDPTDVVREEIVGSWRQSIEAGLRPDMLVVPYDGKAALSAELLQSVEPVTDRLARDIVDTDVSLLVTDADARIVRRRSPSALCRRRLDILSLAPGWLWPVEAVGTTSIGLATSLRSSVRVDGGEHFMDALVELASASSTITDPRSGEVLGALTIVCPVASVSSLMLPLVRRARQEIEERLLDRCSARSRLVEERFLRARRGCRTPLAVVSDRALLMNAAGTGVLGPGEQRSLWNFARQAISLGDTSVPPYETEAGISLAATVEAIRDAGELVGAVIRLFPHAAEAVPMNPALRRHRARHHPQYGWTSLTAPERCLAELVADGLTNKEAAARLFLSRHTVDSHLRHIFRKLEINSRVALARLVVEVREGSLAA
jgi:DNA-binding CsgD family transcriptional regulator/transcriptional regulator of acetoin/glycerol metabolism